MATLATIVAQLPIIIRSRYDFATFWVPKGNDLLNEINQYVRFIDNIKIAGVEVTANHWITQPSDYRSAIDVYFPTSKDSKYHWDEINGRIRLEESFGKLSAASHNLFNFTTSGVNIDLITTEDDTYADYLLVIASNMYESLNNIISASTPYPNTGSPTGTTLIAQEGFTVPLPPSELPYSVSTGTTDSCTNTIYGLTGHTFQIGDLVTVDKGFPSTTEQYEVTDKTAGTIDIDVASTSAKTDVTVTKVTNELLAYLTNQYLILRYIADLEVLTSQSSECPMSNRYEKAFLAGLRWKAEQDMDEGSDVAKYWYSEWQRELQLLQGDASKSIQNRSYGTTLGEAAERLTEKQRQRAGL